MSGDDICGWALSHVMAAVQIGWSKFPNGGHQVTKRSAPEGGLRGANKALRFTLALASSSYDQPRLAQNFSPGCEPIDLVARDQPGRGLTASDLNDRD
jgi:hypothetical protein